MIYLRAMLLNVVDMLGLPPAIVSTIHCRFHEDNASVLLLANSQHLNNQNKYRAVKLHHILFHVKPGVIEVVKCNSKLMLADTFTKTFVREVFEWPPLLIMGWLSQCVCGDMRFQVKELRISYTHYVPSSCIFVSWPVPPKWK